MHYLYTITYIPTETIVYCGQQGEKADRWYNHKWNAKQNKPAQIIECAMKKYGIENYRFEVVATSLTQENTNEVEIQLVEQYNTHISKGIGYNILVGGKNAPHTEETKEKLRQWWKEHRTKRSKYTSS